MIIAFDLDGTLIDSRRDLADAANALIAERGGQPLSVAAIAGMVGEGAGLLVRRALTAASLDPQDPTALPRFLDLYADRLLGHTRLYDGVAEALDALDGVPLALLTNKPRAASAAILEGLGIARHFRWVLGGDGDLPRKPDPASLQYLMTEAGSDPAHTVMIGDSAVDLATARNAGTRVIVARYGFGFRSDEIQLREGEAVVDAPQEIPQAVRTQVGS